MVAKKVDSANHVGGGGGVDAGDTNLITTWTRAKVLVAKVKFFDTEGTAARQ